MNRKTSLLVLKIALVVPMAAVAVGCALTGNLAMALFVTVAANGVAVS